MEKNKGRKRKIIVTEAQLKALVGEMAYPSNFNFDEFRNITNFRDRIRYCSQRLKILGTGSSRRAYQVDNEKVLKIAINRRGVAQNEQEVDASGYRSDVLPHVFDFDDEKYLWIETELARKATPDDFKRETGFDMKTVFNAIRQYEQEFRPTWVNHQVVKKEFLPKEVYQKLWENDWFYSLSVYIGDYQPPIGDLTVLWNYGVVKRNGQEHLIVIDAGLSEEIWKEHYAGRPMKIVWK